MYPDADNGLIEGNIFRSVNDVAILFAGKGDGAADNTVVSGNVIALTREEFNVDTLTGQSSPSNFSGNVVRDNCAITQLTLNDNPDGSGIKAAMPGMTLSGNITADPLFDSQDCIKAGTACAAKFTGPASNTY